jgi:hypothetical protein
LKGLGTAALVLAVAGPCAAQAPSASPSPSARNRSRFEFSLRVQGAYDDNVFRTAAEVDGYIGDASAGLAYSRQSRRSSLQLEGQATAERYKEYGELSRIDYAGRGALNLTVFRRTTINLNQTYASSYTRDIPALANEGLVLPLVVANRAESTLQVGHPLSSRWRVDLDGRYERVFFPDQQLSNGEELTVFPSLQRRFGRSFSVAIGYAFQESRSGGLDDQAHGVLGGIRRRPPKGVGYLLLGGAAYLPQTQTTIGIGTGELSFNRKKDRAAARYERGIKHAFGLGRQVISDLFSFSVSRDLARSLTLQGTGTIGINNDPADPDFRFRSDTYTGSLQWAVTAELSANAGFTHWRSTLGRGEVTPSNRGYVSLGYRVGW